MDSGYISQIVSKMDSVDAFTVGVMVGGLVIFGLFIVMGLVDDVVTDRQRRRDFVEWAARNGVELAPPPTLWQQYVTPFTAAVGNAFVSVLLWIAARDITTNR